MHTCWRQRRRQAFTLTVGKWHDPRWGNPTGINASVYTVFINVCMKKKNGKASAEIYNTLSGDEKWNRGHWRKCTNVGQRTTFSLKEYILNNSLLFIIMLPGSGLVMHFKVRIQAMKNSGGYRNRNTWRAVWFRRHFIQQWALQHFVCLIRSVFFNCEIYLPRNLPRDGSFSSSKHINLKYFLIKLWLFNQDVPSSTSRTKTEMT